MASGTQTVTCGRCRGVIALPALASKARCPFCMAVVTAPSMSLPAAPVSRALQTPAPLKATAGWKCRVCTLDNLAPATECVACGSPASQPTTMKAAPSSLEKPRLDPLVQVVPPSLRQPQLGPLRVPPSSGQPRLAPLTAQPSFGQPQPAPVTLPSSRLPTPTGPVVPLASVASWTCSACTLENRGGAEFCDACHARRPPAGATVPLTPVSSSGPPRTLALHQPPQKPTTPALSVASRAVDDGGAVLGDLGCSESEERAADDLYMAVVSEALRTGHAFCDAAFPAAASSLGSARVEVRVVPAGGGTGRIVRAPVLWRRPPDLADELGSFGPHCTLPAPSALLAAAEGRGLDSAGDADALSSFSRAELRDLASVVRKSALATGARAPPSWSFRSGPISGGDVSQVWRR